MKEKIYYVSTCPDTNKQFLCQVGKDNNIIELNLKNVNLIKKIFKQMGK